MRENCNCLYIFLQSSIGLGRLSVHCTYSVHCTTDKILFILTSCIHTCNVKPFFGVQRQLLIYLHAAQNGELLKTLVIPLKTTEGDYTVLSVLYRKLV